MYYVSTFDPDPTKSFTNVAFNNIKALQTQRINFELRPLNFILNWGNAPSWFTEQDRDYFVHTKPSTSQAALVHLQISDLLKVPYTSAENAIGVTAFEASGVPRWICEGLNQSYRGMIVPSEHCANALRNSGLTIPVRAVKHALPDMWLKDYQPLSEKDQDVYTFGFAGNWNSRKNPITVLRAYLEAFPEPQDSVALILKTFQAGDIEGFIRSSYGENRPDIWVYDESFSEAQMLWLFQMIDCYVSPHRGEGFGLTLAQNAALGKPSIFTGYSAPTEWLRSPHIEVPHTLRRVSETQAIADFKFDHVKDASLEWADVAVSDLASCMADTANRRLKTGFEGESLAQFRSSLSWEQIGLDLVDAAQDILERPLERI